MCYSKEVSLFAGSFIMVGSGFSWVRYYAAALASRAKKALAPFERDVLLGIGCVGMHQLFEFWAISTGSILVYKIGLIWSISCMYFLMRSLEDLTHLRFGSRAFLIVIALLSVHIFWKEMSFEGKHFWIRGYSTAVWSAVWMALFFYWNFCVLYLRSVTRSETNKRLLLWYPLCVLNFSFLLSLSYAYASALVQRSLAAFSLFSTIGMGNVMSSFQLVQDSPSIWCILASTQVILIPFLFREMRRHYDLKAPLRIRSVSVLTEAKLVAWDLAVWLALFFTLPVFPGVALKMVFR